MDLNEAKARDIALNFASLFFPEGVQRVQLAEGYEKVARRCFQEGQASILDGPEVQALRAEIAELNKQIAGLMSGFNLNVYKDAIDKERHRAEALVEALKKSLGVWGAIHAHLRIGGPIDLPTICLVMDEMEAVLSAHRGES